MTDTVEQLMWSYQERFRASADRLARSIIETFDPQLDPQLLLVGLLIDDDEARPRLCVVPDGGSIPLASLDKLSRHLARIQPSIPEDQRLTTLPAEHARRAHRGRQALGLAIAVTLGGAHPDRLFFANYPEAVEGYLVSALLHLDREAYDLAMPPDDEPETGQPERPASLLDATIRTLLAECRAGLRDAQPGSSSGWSRATDDLMRDAGRLLMGSVERRLDEGASITLFDHLCDLAALRYEGSEGHGRVLLTGESRVGVEVAMEFDDRVSFGDVRRARKLLEMAGGAYDLLATPSGIFGLGVPSDTEGTSGAGVFGINIQRHNAWELRQGDRALMWVQDGRAGPPRPPLRRRGFEATVRRVFAAEEEVDIDRLWRIAETVRRQRRGTLLVISSGAASEARRLASQSTAVSPVPLTPGLVAAVTTIDGAILIDPVGRCHAIGAILDGLATAEGDQGRGARYHSALRYVSTAKQTFGHDVVALVVSEDGMIDLLPRTAPPA